MSYHVALFALGLGLLAASTGLVVRGGAQLARRWSVNPYVVGLIALGMGASVGGLAFCICAVAHGRPRLAVGNLLGGNIANVGLVLGLAAIVRPLAGSAKLISSGIPALLIAALLFWFLSRDNELSQGDAGVLLAAFVAVLIYLGRIARQEPDSVRVEIAGWVPDTGSAWVGAIQVVLGVVGLVGGAELAVSEATRIYGESKITTPVLGFIAIIGTVLPGLVFAIAAARRGRANVVFGIVIGTNLTSLLLVSEATAMTGEFLLLHHAVMNEVPAMCLFMLLLITPLANGLKVSRVEGAILLAAFVAYAVWQVTLAFEPQH